MARQRPRPHEDYYSDDIVEPVERKGTAKLKVKLLLLSIFAAIGYSTVGSTFATDIQLGSGRVEFGQGVVASTACDSSITVTPFATFANASGDSAAYKLTDIQLSGIDSTCRGKDFIIRVFDSATATPLTLYQTGGITNYDSIRVFNNGGLYSLAAAGLNHSEINAVTDGFRVTLFNSASPASIALAPASSVYRITVESVNHDATLTQSLLPSGSLLFNGTSTSIDYSSNSIFTLGSTPFTIDVIANVKNSRANGTFYDAGGDVNSSGGFAFWIEDRYLYIRYNGISGNLRIPMQQSWYDSWHHFAAVRGNGYIRAYVDGVKVLETADSGYSISRSAPTLGRLSSYTGFDLDGEIRNIRVVKGSALYSSNFTAPTSPLTKVSGTILLLLAQDQGNRIYDSSDNHFVPSNSNNLPIWIAP